MITTDEDPTNPRSQFFLNYDESPAQKLVASWSLGFVDESISEPKETEKIRFSESNNNRVYVLEQKLRNLRQENNRVSLYFAQLKTLWDEISSCESVCVCITTNCPVLVEMKKREERKRIMVFLMGLNDGLAQARNQVLLRDPLPSLDEVVNLISQEESNQEHAGKLPQAVAMRNGDQIVLQQENTSIAEQSTVGTTTTPLVPRFPTEPDVVKYQPSPIPNPSPTLSTKTGPEVVEQQLSPTTSPSKSVTFNSKHISAHVSSDSLPECTTNREKENQEDSKTSNQPRSISEEDNSVRSCAAANFEPPRAPFSLESTFKEKPDQLKNTNQGIAVDTSLSTTMGSPEIISSNKSPLENYGFQHLIDAGLPVCSDGAFRDNIRQFVLNCAKLEDYDLEGMSVWRTSLVYEKRGEVVPLYTVEESVKCSDSPFCNYCRSAGWEHHLVSKKKYHLIIPGNDEWNNRLDKGAFDLQTHLLHGLIHSNGYGHLICINGIEGGSKFIHGREIMNLWDRICTSLHARQISVIDKSRKHNVDLRVLYGVSYEQSWFSRWGYRYVRGRFGVEERVYQMSIDRIRSIEVGRVIDGFPSMTIIEEIISYYEGKNGKKFVTIRDLFRFMLKQPGWKNRFVIKSKEKSVPLPYLARYSGVLWPVKRLESAVEVIVDVLKEKGGGSMSRQEARDAALPRIDDKMLVEYVLTLMDNVIVGNCMVRRAANRCSKMVEYSIQDIKGKDSEAGIATTSEGRMVDDDIANLYKMVLCRGPFLGYVLPTVNVVLHCKNFIKEFPLRDEDGLRYTCRLTRSSIGVIDDDFQGFQPGESVTVPVNATVGDLKMAVQKAMRETYCVMEKLTVLEILGLEEGVRDEDGIKELVESGNEIWFKCCGLDLESALRFEGRGRVIDCECGTQDDDGDRMVECVHCRVWHHTSCNLIMDRCPSPLVVLLCDPCVRSRWHIQDPLDKNPKGMGISGFYDRL